MIFIERLTDVLVFVENFSVACFSPHVISIREMISVSENLTGALVSVRKFRQKQERLSSVHSGSSRNELVICEAHALNDTRKILIG